MIIQPKIKTNKVFENKRVLPLKFVIEICNLRCRSGEIFSALVRAQELVIAFIQVIELRIRLLA